MTSSREQLRLAELRAHEVADTPPEPVFDEIAVAAATVAGTPLAFVTLLDETTQWLKARVGTDNACTPRSLAMCDEVVRAETEVVVPDLRRDPRFAGHPAVTADKPVLFYAGFPLTTPAGFVLGTLCVVDVRPRDLSAEQLSVLRVLARQVMAQLVLRRTAREQAGELHRRRETERALALSEQRHREAFWHSPVGHVELDPSGRLVRANPAMARVLGYDDPDDLLGLAAASLVAPADRAQHRAAIAAMFTGSVDTYEAERALLRRDGSEVPVIISTGVLRDAAGQVAAVIGSVFDVTERREAMAAMEQAHQRLAATHAELARAHESLAGAHRELSASRNALQHSESLFRAAFEHGPMAMCRLDVAGAVTHGNPALRRLLGRPDREIVGQHLAGLVEPADRERFGLTLAAAAHSGLDVDVIEVRLQRLDRRSVWCEVAVTSGTDERGEPFVLVQLADIHDRKLREQLLEDAASRDSLTGVANRAALVRALEARLADPSAGAAPLLVYADLDGFKAVNDTAGHHVGDEVLVGVAQRLLEVVRPGDTVARLGGDEFVVLVGPNGERDGGRALSRRIEAALTRPLTTTAGPVVVGASIGCALGCAGETPAALLARADGEMYAAKLARQGASVIGPPRRRFNAAGHAGQPRLADLVATAAGEGRLDLALQPVVDLASGCVVGAEALLRMRDRTGDLIMPDAFIPIAEATGAIHDLGEWVLRAAAARGAELKRLLPAPTEFAIGINLSPRQLDDPNRLLGVLDDLSGAGTIETTAVVLELTERLLTPDTAVNRRLLADIRERGFHLACDDFGSGHASLRYLTDFPIDIVKIDRTWVGQLAPGSAHLALARGVVRLAAASGLVVVAEGVEHESVRAELVAEGCRLAQGYLFGGPTSYGELHDLLVTGSGRLREPVTHAGAAGPSLAAVS